MHRIAWLLSLLLLAPLADLAAQGVPPLAPGARVRITAPSVIDHRFVTTLVALDADTLLLETEFGGRLAIPLTSVARFEVSRGQKSRILKYAGIGLLTGVGVGMTVGAFTGEASCFNNENICFEKKEAAIIGGIGLGFLGTVIGATAGAIRRAERWEEMPLERIRVSLSPQRGGGVRLAASFKF